MELFLKVDILYDKNYRDFQLSPDKMMKNLSARGLNGPPQQTTIGILFFW